MSGNQGQDATGPARNLPLHRDLLFLVHQFLNEEGLHETAHSLERDTQMYFDLKYLEELILTGKWAEADWYLRGFFLDVQGNRFGRKLVFEIYKQKYLEALYRHDMLGAYAILQTEFRSILSRDQDIYQQLTGLFYLDDFRAHPRLKEWCNPEKARATLCGNMRNVIVQCPDLMDKLQYPAIPPPRMSTLLSQSCFWQHYLCEKKLPNPVWTTLLKDHDCSEQPQHFGPLPQTKVPMSSAAGPSIVDVRCRLAADLRSARNFEESSRKTNTGLDSQRRDSVVPAKEVQQSTCRIQIMNDAGPSTAIAVVEKESSVGSSNSRKESAPLPPNIELVEESDEETISASQSNGIN